MDVTVNIAVRIKQDKDGNFSVSVATPAESGHRMVDDAVRSATGQVVDRVYESLKRWNSLTLKK